MLSRFPGMNPSYSSLSGRDKRDDGCRSSASAWLKGFLVFFVAGRSLDD
jgi:hypothetical protein